MSALDVFMHEQLARLRKPDWTPRQTFKLSGRPNPRRVPELPEIGNEAWHGTSYGYDTKKCRCHGCSAANATRKRDLRRKAAERLAKNRGIERTLRRFAER